MSLKLIIHNNVQSNTEVIPAINQKISFFIPSLSHSLCESLNNKYSFDRDREIRGVFKSCVVTKWVFIARMILSSCPNPIIGHRVSFPPSFQKQLYFSTFSNFDCISFCSAMKPPPPISLSLHLCIQIGGSIR